MAGVTSKSRGAASRFPEVDGLRAIAVSLVLLDHFLSHAVPLALVRRITAFGWIGVDLFFVISGFLIGGILLDQREASNYYRVFYTRRFFRIIPLYLVLTLPAFLVVGLGLQGHFSGHSLASMNGWVMLLYLCFMQNLGGGLIFSTPSYLSAMWSLAVEEQFYLLLPPLVRNLRVRSLLKLMVVAIISAPLLRGGLFLLFPAEALRAGMASYSLLPCRWDSLLLGVASAYAWRDPRRREWLTARIAQVRTVWLILAVGMVALTLSGLSEYHPLVAVGGYTWIAAFFTATLLLARFNPAGWASQWLGLRALKPIATVSYGLYLWQGLMITLKVAVVRHTSWPEIGWKATGANMLALAATGLAAALSWKLFESRLIQFGHQNSYQKLPRTPAAIDFPGAVTQK